MREIRNRAKMRTRVLKIRTMPEIVDSILNSIRNLMSLTINIENVEKQPPLEEIRAAAEPAYVLLACIINHELIDGVDRKVPCYNKDLSGLHVEMSPTLGNMRIRVEWVTENFRQSILVDFVPRDERSVVTRLVELQGHQVVQDYRL
jgi:hypothetical protein